jgi:DNA-binding response OmpR family regulator
VSELPQMLVVEDEYAVQGFVEDALTEAGSRRIFCPRAKKR